MADARDLGKRVAEVASVIKPAPNEGREIETAIQPKFRLLKTAKEVRSAVMKLITLKAFLL